MSLSQHHILDALSPYQSGFPNIEILQSLSAWLADLLRTTDKKILVHCVASVNRSSLLIGCILHRFLDLRGDALIRYLEEKSGGYAILTNRQFREYLESLQEQGPGLGGVKKFNIRPHFP